MPRRGRGRAALTETSKKDTDMNYKRLLSTALLTVALALQATAYTVTPVEGAPQWQIDWSADLPRPEWQEPDASTFSSFAVMLVTIEEALQPYVSADDLLAIFVGDEVRGVATPLVLADGTVDATRFLLKAYSDESEGDKITVSLKYYNAQLKQLFALSESMTLGEDNNLGIYDDFVPKFTEGTTKYAVTVAVDATDLLAQAGVQPGEGDMLAAFVGDECRAVISLPADQDQWPVLNVLMNEEGEEVVVKYYDAKNNRIISFDKTLKGDVNIDGLVNGTDVVALTNIILGKSEPTDVADVNGDGVVNGTDYVALVNIVLGKDGNSPMMRAALDEGTATTGLSIEPYELAAGGETEIVIDLTNPEDEITLVQFDLRLPAGLSLKTIDGEYDYDIAGRTTWRKHSLDANALDDGAIRFLLASPSNAVLSGMEGAIIKMTVVADNSYTGEAITLENILLVTPDLKEVKPEDVESLPTGIATVTTDGIVKDAPVYSLSGQRLTAPRKGVNIVGGRKVLVK